MDIINFNLRIPEDLNDRIAKIAKKEGRSKNKQIEYILRNYADGVKPMTAAAKIGKKDEVKKV